MRSCSMMLVTLSLVLGCGSGSSKLAPVSGKVTLDGQPLADATVIFQPEGGGPDAGSGSQGKTNANGEFTLRQLNSDRDGAVAGKHRVMISAPQARAAGGGDKPHSEEQEKTVDRVPAKYNANTTLNFDVPAGGSSTANFDLKSK
jgi:hypothetical protein